MRLVHLSDVHFDERRQLAGAVRVDADGVNAALASAAACVEHVRVTALASGPVYAWLITGDLFDTPTPTPLEERFAVEAIERMAESAPVIVLAGNHDVPAAGSGATALECLRLRRNVYVVEQPCVLYFGDNGRTTSARSPRLALVCLPYPRRAELVAIAPEGSREERNAAASTILRGLVQGLRLQAEREAPHAHRVALYHGSLDGATVGVQPRTLSGDVALSPADFADFAYAACGHIHKMQRLAPNVYYAGSPDRVDFDEERDYKGALLVDLEPLTVRPLPTPARSYVTATPEELDAPLESWRVDGTVYRVKGDAGTEEAAAIRRRVAELAEAGVWISASALRVTSEVRARDEEARADESVSSILGRWLAANPNHVESIIAEHGGEPEATCADILTLSHTIAGE